MELTISKRERYLAAGDYLLGFFGFSLLDLLEGMSKNTEFMSFHRRQWIRIAKFIGIGIVLGALFLGLHILFQFSESVMRVFAWSCLVYIIFFFFFTFKGMYYAITGQTKKVF